MQLPCLSWGQYQWNDTLFPSPLNFSQRVHSGTTPIDQQAYYFRNASKEEAAGKAALISALVALPSGARLALFAIAAFGPPFRPS